MNPRSILVVWLLVICCAFAGPGVAQSPSDIAAAQEEFALGNAAFGEREWRSAIAHFQAAHALAPHPRLLEYLGRCYAHMNDFANAVAHYEQFADSSPEAAAEIAEVLAATRQTAIEFTFFEARGAVEDAQARAAGDMPEPRTTMRSAFDSLLRDVVVQVRSEPPGAQVFLNDISLGPIGVTPLQANMFVGTTWIEVRLANHQPAGQLVNITASGTSIPVFEFELQPIEVPVEVSVTPLTAAATWIGASGDTRSLGVGAWEGPLPAGPATFLLQQGGRDRRIEVDIQPADDGLAVPVALSFSDTVTGAASFALATLVVVSQATDGEVFVDGRSVGRAPGEFVVDLTPGSHSIELRRERYCSWRQNVELEDDDETRVYTPTSLERRCR